jgi:chaperonin GroEL
VVILRDKTTIIEGAGTPESVTARINKIRGVIQHTADQLELDNLQDRLARLAGGVAVIYAGGVTEIDVIDQKYKIMSALNSATSSIYEGWLPGGGNALLGAKRAVDQLTGRDEAEQAGLQTISYTLEQPVRRLIESVKPGDMEILDKAAKSPSDAIGFNVETRIVENLVDTGILDPARSMRISLEVAFSHAQAILQTGAWDLGETQVENSGNSDESEGIFDTGT